MMMLSACRRSQKQREVIVSKILVRYFCRRHYHRDCYYSFGNGIPRYITSGTGGNKSTSFLSSSPNTRNSSSSNDNNQNKVPPTASASSSIVDTLTPSRNNNGSNNKSNTKTKSSSSSFQQQSTSSSSSSTSSSPPNKRLPALSGKYEFPPDTYKQLAKRRWIATSRMLWMAAHRVVEPPTLHLLAAAACTTLGIGLVEGTMLCQQIPFYESIDAGRFVLRYSLEQLIPSVVWETQDPKLVAIALNLNPDDGLLRDLSGETYESANLILQTNLLAAGRSFFAGFMMIAQLVRAAGVSIGAFEEYTERIQLGKEPPIFVPPPKLKKHRQGQQEQPQLGLVVRLCGMDSFVTEVSMKTMGTHIFPVFEDPERIQFLIWNFSDEKRRPIYWRVRPGLYGSAYSWDRFPADAAYFFQGVNKQDRILILEADATNGNDPLTLDETALDLTIDDTSQGFRRILEQYASNGLIAGRHFRTLRVYLGNSMEIATTGGGHSYTLRHRVRYAKEVDVLIDSRAPVLHKILEWCNNVVGKDRKLFFQTSSREYFLNLKELLKEYGYEILDPLDLRMLHKLRQDQEQQSTTATANGSAFHDELNKQTNNNDKSLMSVLLDDATFMEEWEDHGAFLEDISTNKQQQAQTIFEQQGKQQALSSTKNRREMLRMVAKMSKLPRLVHMETTAATVNAVEALIAAGEIQTGGSCAALIDRQEGVQALERTLRQKSDFVESYRHQWTMKTKNDDGTEKDKGEKTEPKKDGSKNIQENPDWNGIQIICSSSIHDEQFRQVRLWARMGYSAAEIQREVDAQCKEVLQKSYTIQQVVNTSHHQKDDDSRANNASIETTNRVEPSSSPTTATAKATTTSTILPTSSDSGASSSKNSRQRVSSPALVVDDQTTLSKDKPPKE